MRGPLPWETYAHGEYVGPHRDLHVPEYRLRPDDELEMVFRLTRERSGRPYELAVSDRIRIESIGDKDLDRELEVQPDGSLTLPLVGQVLGAGRTTDEVRLDLEKRYKEFYKNPAITVTPIRVNTKLEDLRATVDSRAGQGGQSRIARVAPDGTISLPALGKVPAQGLTLDELKREVDARYNSLFDGIEITPVLSRRAPRFIYVVGDVRKPGRFEMVGPTTVIQSIALAEGTNVGANLRQIVIFRRAADWRLLATKIDVRGALYGQRPAPSDELWLRDSDVVVVPKSPVKTVTDAISLIATQGVYAAAPFLVFNNSGGGGVVFSEASTVP
jgi:polysaccharide export outer membrane protein